MRGLLRWEHGGWVDGWVVQVGGWVWLPERATNEKRGMARVVEAEEEVNHAVQVLQADTHVEQRLDRRVYLVRVGVGVSSG